MPGRAASGIGSASACGGISSVSLAESSSSTHLLIYPLIGLSLGRVYPASPTFGLPCPTTIFTFGILLWIDRRVPVHLAMVPLLWAVIGTSAVFSFDIVEDAALAVAGAVTAILLFRRNRRLRPLNPF